MEPKYDFYYDLTTEARVFACDAHSKVGHQYGELEYSHHLNMVFETGLKHINLLPEGDRFNALRACWLHDTIEDCRLTFNDIKKEFGEEVAEVVYRLTTNKGRTRAERTNDQYYSEIREHPIALFVKLCDRISNVCHSRIHESRMYGVYFQEHGKFFKHLYSPPFRDLWVELSHNFYPFKKKWTSIPSVQTTFEVSSVGDKRFSAFYARLGDGRTVEEVYQLDIKGYRYLGDDPMLGKGKPPRRDISHEGLWDFYLNLWRMWSLENETLMEELEVLSEGKELCDRFAIHKINQAHALATLINERNGLNIPPPLYYFL